MSSFKNQYCCASTFQEEAVPLLNPTGFQVAPQQISPKDEAVTRTGMLALTPLPLYQSKPNFPYCALGETISGCGRGVEHIAGSWETPGNKPCVSTKGLVYAKHSSSTSTASMMPLPRWPPW